MTPHQERVVQEEKELGDKLEKLTAFFSNPTFKTLPDDERCLLRLQAVFMANYDAILQERIAHF